MILRKLTLDNWRGVSHFEMELDAGINLLLGRNEAGKSSIVEALDWALYRDITGARLSLDEVRSIIPASDPSAKPEVRVELEFFDCSATLVKVLAEDSSRRECRLTIHRPGAADERFDRTEAQRRLRSLFTSDGLGAEKGNVAEASLLIAHQGEAASYLADGSTAMRSTLGVAADGNLALTSRLERVRLQVENARRRELTQDLGAEALEAARASTEAAGVREKLAEAQRQLMHFEAVERELEAYRDEVAELDARLAELSAQEAAAKARVDHFSELIVKQAEADTLIAQAETGVREAEAKRETALNRAREIEHLRVQQAAGEERLAGCQSALQTVQESLEAQREACEASARLLEQALSEVEEARQIADAWRAYLAVFDARELQRADARALERLEALETAVRESAGRFEALEAVPSRREVAGWREAQAELERLEREAAQTLQIFVTPEENGTLAFWRDGGDAEEVAAEAGETLSLNAMGDGELKIPGFGRIRFRNGARGAEELREAVEGARRELAARLEPWGLEIGGLAAALGGIEERIEEFEAAEQAAGLARQAFGEAEQQNGTLAELRMRVEQRQADYEEAKRNCEPYSGLISLGGRARAEVKQAQDAAQLAAREAESRAARARNEGATAQQRLRLAEADFAEASRLPETLRAAMESRTAQLDRLESDGIDAGERAKLVEELAFALWAARQRLEEARSARAALGNAVSNWQTEEARQTLARVSAERAADEKRLVELRRDIWHHSGEDAFGQMEKLKAEIEELEASARAQENRLRGLALLDAALKVERSRLGRALAGPLNEKLAPWLSKLRGKETRIEFDESGSRIEAVGTVTEAGSIALPFKEHSEGMKEQIALALRLLLATRVANHLPSKRLAVVLDDPFTQSDAGRREGLASVLNEAAGSVQILLVSCHEEQIPASLGGRKVLLGEPVGRGDVEAPGPVVKAVKVKKVVVGEESLSLF